MPETFGFKVRTHRGAWAVSLPHQCGDWGIAGEDGHDGVPHDEAVARLESFIAEATTALEHLRRGEPFNDPYGEEPGPDTEVVTAGRNRWTWKCHTCGTTSKATYTSRLTAEDAADWHDCEGEDTR